MRTIHERVRQSTHGSMSLPLLPPATCASCALSLSLSPIALLKPTLVSTFVSLLWL